MSKTKSFLPVKGFRDFTPSETLTRLFVVEKIRKVFESYGFDPIETPALEYLETFAGQIGEDEKLFYKFKDLGGRDVALRYDQTVPTCRFVSRFLNDLPMPFKRYQIQPVWRAENPQKGRYREFIMCDADIFGIKEATADAETIALSLKIYQKLGFKEFKVIVNDRTLYRNIPYPVIASIDKLKKIGREKVLEEIVKKGFAKKESEEYLNTVVNFKPNNTIITIFKYLNSLGFSENNYRFEPTLARSFSYSSGPIWEVELPGYEVGSVVGGERYDKLVSTFTGKELPATGFAVGFDRTVEAMEQFGLLPKATTTTEVLITIFSDDLTKMSLRVAEQLRNRGITTDVYPNSNAKLDKQLRYADKKGVPFALIMGPEELKENKVMLKDLKNKSQKKVTVEEAVKELGGK